MCSCTYLSWIFFHQLQCTNVSCWKIRFAMAHQPKKYIYLLLNIPTTPGAKMWAPLRTAAPQSVSTITSLRWTFVNCFGANCITIVSSTLSYIWQFEFFSFWNHTIIDSRWKVILSQTYWSQIILQDCKNFILWSFETIHTKWSGFWSPTQPFESFLEIWILKITASEDIENLIP